VNLNADVGLAVLVDNLEGEVLDVILNRLVLELLTDETFDIEAPSSIVFMCDFFFVILESSRFVLV